MSGPNMSTGPSDVLSSRQPAQGTGQMTAQHRQHYPPAALQRNNLPTAGRQGQQNFQPTQRPLSAARPAASQLSPASPTNSEIPVASSSPSTQSPFRQEQRQICGGPYANAPQTQYNAQFGSNELGHWSPVPAVRANRLRGPPGLTSPAATPALFEDAQSRSQPSLVAKPLNKAFDVKPRSWYKVGRVFHALYSEVSWKELDNESWAWSMNSFGEWIYTKPRRFVIIRADHFACLALPITTHERLGVSKKGTKKSDYVVIYTGKNAPEILPGEHANRDEEPIQPLAIRVDVDDRSYKLDPISRLHLARPQPIDYRHRVKGFGFVNPRSMDALSTQFKNVIGTGVASNIMPSSTPSPSARLVDPTADDQQVFGILVRSGCTSEWAAGYVNRKSNSVRQEYVMERPREYHQQSGEGPSEKREHLTEVG